MYSEADEAILRIDKAIERMETRCSLDEFHRGFTGGERHAARKLLAVIKDASIEGKEMLMQRLELVCRQELELTLKEIEDDGE